MANDFYTLIVVPNAKGRFRKFHIPVRFAKWATWVGAGLAVVLAGILVHYIRINGQAWENGRLRVENQSLRAKNHEYELNAGKLQAKVQGLQNTVTKLGVMAGIERSLPDSAVGGVGGVSSGESAVPALDAGIALRRMDDEVSVLTDQSSRLEEFYKDQKILLASTPSIWPVRGYLSASFGNRIDPFTNQWDFHSGIDISTPIGTKVYTPADGVVVSSGERGAYGRAIIIDHGYGIVTQYGHLDGYAVKPGQRVRRGDLIGYVGNTGRSTGPHLHYEVWVRNQAQNPVHFILDEYRSFG